jgi:hypothetical protein
VVLDARPEGAAWVPPRWERASAAEASARAVTPGGDGTSGWAGALLYASLGLAGATLLVQFARFLRGSWNP